MARVLIVTQAFADYSKGERISDPELVEILFASHRGHVVPVNEPDIVSVDPEPFPKSPKPAKSAEPPAAEPDAA